MITEKEPNIKSAYDQLQIISHDKQKRMEYEAREKAIRNYNQGMFEAEQRGEQRGVARVNKLNALLLQNKRFEDLERSSKDVDYQEQLMQEFGI